MALTVPFIVCNLLSTLIPAEVEMVFTLVTEPYTLDALLCQCRIALIITLKTFLPKLKEGTRYFIFSGNLSTPKGISLQALNTL